MLLLHDKHDFLQQHPQNGGRRAEPSRFQTLYTLMEISRYQSQQAFTTWCRKIHNAFYFWSLISFKTHRIEKMFWHIVLLSDFHSGDKTRESWLPSKQAYPTNKRPKLHVHLPPSKKYPKDSNKAIQSPHSSSLTPLTSPQKSPLTQPYPPSFPSHSSQTTP